MITDERIFEDVRKIFQNNMNQATMSNKESLSYLIEELIDYQNKILVNDTDKIEE